MTRYVSTCTWALSLALASVAPAQDIVWARPGILDTFRPLGWLLELSDLDGDGFNEFACQGYYTCNPRYPWNIFSQASILRGSDGSFVRAECNSEYTLPEALGPFPAGDYDGDGARDFVRITRDAGFFNAQYVQEVTVVSGRNKTVLVRVADHRVDEIMYVYATADIDVDGDGRNDLAIVGRNFNNPFARKDRVVVYRHDGRILYDLNPVYATSEPVAFPDLDGDGCMEILFCSVDYTNTTGGQINLYSGRTGTLIRSHPGAQPFWDYRYFNGCAVLPCGDIDRDGIVDYAGTHVALLSQEMGTAAIYSGATGAVIRSWQEPELDGFGGRLAVADCDRDGVSDLVVRYGIGRTTIRNSTELRCLSGRDGSVLATLIADGRHPTTPLNYALAAYRYASGAPRGADVFPVIAAAEWGYGQTTSFYSQQYGYLGRVTLFRTAPAGVRGYGRGCMGTLSAVPGIGWRALSGTQARVHLTDAPPGASAFLFIGFSDTQRGGVALPLDLSFLGLPGCSLLSSAELVIPAVAGNSGIDLGYASIDVPRAPVALFGQWAVFSAVGNGIALSQGLRW